MNDYEMDVIEFEEARNECMDQWFKSRPHIERSKEAEFLFEGGFRMAWDIEKTKTPLDNDGE